MENEIVAGDTYIALNIKGSAPGVPPIDLISPIIFDPGVNSEVIFQDMYEIGKLIYQAVYSNFDSIYADSQPYTIEGRPSPYTFYQGMDSYSNCSHFTSKNNVAPAIIDVGNASYFMDKLYASLNIYKDQFSQTIYGILDKLTYHGSPLEVTPFAIDTIKSYLSRLQNDNDFYTFYITIENVVRRRDEDIISMGGIAVPGYIPQSICDNNRRIGDNDLFNLVFKKIIAFEITSGYIRGIPWNPIIEDMISAVEPRFRPPIPNISDIINDTDRYTRIERINWGLIIMILIGMIATSIFVYSFIFPIKSKPASLQIYNADEEEDSDSDEDY